MIRNSVKKESSINNQGIERVGDGESSSKRDKVNTDGVMTREDYKEEWKLVWY